MATNPARRGDPCANCEPIGAQEIAALLNVQANTVHIWKYRGLLPPPRWNVGNQPLWARNDIEGWARATRRWPPENDAPAKRR